MNRAALWALFVAGALAALCASARAQPGGEASAAPALSPSVREALGAPYLTEDERRAMRVFHGLWESGDLDDPALRARAALIAGVWDDASLDDEAAAVEDRAEARLLRGDLEEALELLAGAASVRARRIRAEALEGLGRFADADAAVEPIAAQMLRTRFENAAELVEGVRALMIRARVRGQPAQDYHRMRDLLAHARDGLDRLYWPAMRVEAALLYDKDNRQEAGDAALQVLSLNPRSADAYAFLGRLTVDGFDFDRAAMFADRLDALAREFTGDASSFSARAGVVRALAWLRQNDPDMADEALAPALARFPTMREALATRVAALALRHDGDALERALASFAELSPGSPQAVFSAGKALSEARQYGAAAGLLERAASMQPNWPLPYVELGLLELQSGRDFRARDALREATRLDPFNTRARNSLRLIEELLTYETVESDHFVVRYRPGADAVMAREMLEPLEAIHRVVAGAIRHEPDRKTVIELMPDHQWFAVRITGVPAIHTIAACTGPVIAMEAPKVGVRHTGEYDWVRVLRHEYVHTVTLSLTNNRIPHWFTEAAAVHLEGAPRSFDTCRLLARAVRTDDLFDMRKINIAFVRPERPTDRAQAYAQGQWMYEYMIVRWGEDAPLGLMGRYAAGVREEEAIAEVLGVSREEFFSSFREWARGQAASWGLLAEPPVEELLVRAIVETEDGRAEAQTVLRHEARRAGLTMAGLEAPEGAALRARPATPALIEAMARTNPEHPDVMRLRIEAETAQHDGRAHEGMVGLLEEYALLVPVDPTPHRLLASFYLDSEDPSRAIEHLEFLDVREDKSAAYAVELARRYAAIDRLDEAQRKAERATQIAPFNASHREFAARVALTRKDYALAERHIAALVELEPDRAQHKRYLERVRELRGEG